MYLCALLRIKLWSINNNMYSKTFAWWSPRVKYCLLLGMCGNSSSWVLYDVFVIVCTYIVYIIAVTKLATHHTQTYVRPTYLKLEGQYFKVTITLGFTLTPCANLLNVLWYIYMHVCTYIRICTCTYAYVSYILNMLRVTGRYIGQFMITALRERPLYRPNEIMSCTHMRAYHYAYVHCAIAHVHA